MDQAQMGNIGVRLGIQRWKCKERPFWEEGFLTDGVDHHPLSTVRSPPISRSVRE